MGRVKRVDYYKDSSFEIYEYWPDGQVKSIETESGPVSYTYDNRGRLDTETQIDDTVLDYGYDFVGNRKSVKVIRNGVTNSETTYTYDELNRMETVTDASGVTTYSYDDVGNLDTVTYPNDLLADYDYNDINQLTDLVMRDSAGTVVSGYNYGLDATGRRELITEASGRVTDPEYDNLYRLKSEAVTDAVNGNYFAEYQYDWVGNRTYETVDGVQTSYAYDDNDRLTSQGGTTYGHDANGNTLSEILDGVVTSYTYNGRNKMTSVNKAGGLIAAYSYNASGIRNSKTQDGVTTHYVVDSNRDYAQVLEELVNDAAVVKYSYGHDLLSQERSGDVSFYHYDGLGSTRSLSNGAGEVTDSYNYEAFGELLNSTGSTDNSYLYTGEQLDDETGNYYLRARYYDAGIGRFTQQDTYMGNNSDPVSLHKYLYASNDPHYYIDPTGNFSMASVMSAVNVTATLASTAVSSYEFGSAVYEGGGEVSATQAGMFAIASLGGIKVFKLIGKKFLKKFNCGKPGEHKICKIFKSDGERITTLRSTLGIGKKKNIAFADYITSDGVGTMVSASGRHAHPGTVDMPASPRFVTFEIGHSRALDSEVKLYENLALKFSGSTKGITRVVSELPICGSCAAVGTQFRGAFPSVFLTTRGGVTGRKKK